MAGTNSNVCKYFASSSGEGCKFGAMCNFSHDLSSGQGVVPAQPERPEGRHGDVEGQQRRPKRPCRYFRGGFCKDGSRCKFSHDLPVAAPLPIQTRQQSQKQRQRKTICKFFNSTSGCRHGENCRFLHESTKEKNETSEGPSGEAAGNTHEETSPEVKSSQTSNVNTATKSKANPRKGWQRNRGFLENDLSEMTESEQQKARDTEIEVLKKRYPQTKEIPCEKNTTAYQITFKPTDPDWPYDVKSVDLDIYFPATYPVKMMDITLPEQENVPETVRRCVEFSIVDWVYARHKNFEKKGRVERMFRPFLRWLDRDLQDIFTDALTHYQRELIAKASGIEVIPARHLQARYQQRKDGSGSESDEADPENDTRTQGATETTQSTGDQQLEAAPQENSPKLTELQEGNAQFNPTAKGTEIKIRELQLGEGVATLVATSIKLMIRCSRCKESAELVAPNNRLNQMSCSKCNQTQLVKYRAALTHGFSSVLGYLDLEECSPFDLLLMDCDFVANCLSCNKDTTIGGIPPGQLKSSWCKSCHSKLTVAMESVQFRQLQPTTIEKTESVHKVKSANVIRKVKDPAIKEGLPLPDQGTCKHYKKSFRWLRFPCCGKAYPCDVCHEEKEGHEMKFANRMICGYCAHEQMFSGLKPCSACSSSLTNRSTEHWEGGKGCRDVIRMSRSDDKKYANSNKTVSRKSQNKEHSGKKNTKLRHV